ncbi:MAG TPA: hypothetical protein VK890_07150 [Bacteroidia bacterium]|jgi:hypothetical protein|nr:hypothetical protein [Bacteroidia bacterium]
MKKILVLLFGMIATNCFSQYDYQPQEHRPSTWWKHTPGMELRKAGNTFFTGLAFETAGIVFVELGSAINNNYTVMNSSSTGTSTGNTDITIGGFMIIAGGVCNILAWVHVNRAGRLMDLNNKVSFSGTKNGLGLVYKL